MSLETWTAERVQEFADLSGQTVKAWIGVEFALREDVPDAGPHVYHDPAVPCLQLWGLQAHLADNTRFGISNYQNDDHFGLHHPQEPDFDARLQNPDWWREPFQGTRWRELPELPTGRIEEATVLGDEGMVAEVHLLIGGRPLWLIAGELEETWEGTLEFHRLDESVLAFTDPADVERISWRPPRAGLATI
ncbi:hypothetical protein ACFWNN_43510 [Lentzea sp. NPDC058450]|uniref:hypothetical protein n=1 Tax=Lentzea sp. NPDC058450 TaxID=3346505 RepID=UPI00364CA823